MTLPFIQYICSLYVFRVISTVFSDSELCHFLLWPSSGRGGFRGGTVVLSHPLLDCAVGIVSGDLFKSTKQVRFHPNPSTLSLPLSPTHCCCCLHYPLQAPGEGAAPEPPLSHSSQAAQGAVAAAGRFHLPA